MEHLGIIKVSISTMRYHKTSPSSCRQNNVHLHELKYLHFGLLKMSASTRLMITRHIIIQDLTWNNTNSNRLEFCYLVHKHNYFLKIII